MEELSCYQWELLVISPQGCRFGPKNQSRQTLVVSPIFRSGGRYHHVAESFRKCGDKSAMGACLQVRHWNPNMILVVDQPPFCMPGPPKEKVTPFCNNLSGPEFVGAWVSGGNDVIQPKVISVKTKRTLTSLPALQVVNVCNTRIKIVQNLPWKNDNLP